MEPDDGVHLTKHNEHIVALGTRTLEFFYDAGNPTGSTLNARTDLSYEVGAIDQHTVWGESGLLFFVGLTKSGAIGVYMLDGFQIKKVSDPDLDVFLTTARVVDSVKMVASGFQSGGRIYYLLTLFYTPSDMDTESTLCYQAGVGWLGEWELMHTGIDHFPLMAWAPSTATKAGEGILANGDLVTVIDDFNPQDTVAAVGVYESDVFVAGIYTVTAGGGTNIAMEIVTGHSDGGSRKRKFMGELWLAADQISASENVTISIADEQNTTFTTLGTIDASDNDARLNRCGSFRQRNHKIQFSGSKQLKLEALEGYARLGR